MNKVVELFGEAIEEREDWQSVVQHQNCPYRGKRCYKVRKSQPEISIGTCTVQYGKKNSRPVIICPARLLERRQVFTDCLHLLTQHEPGNELHIVSEVSVPGGTVDFFLVSARRNTVRDFVGIEFQTLDTTGTVWPERQRLLRDLDVPRNDEAEMSLKTFGMNWKMTAKTILVQMHHKVQTFEHINKKLALIVQDELLSYMKREFNFGHTTVPARVSDSTHFHSYQLERQLDCSYRLSLVERQSTDADGIGTCLGLQAEARIELAQITVTLQARISPATLFTPA